MSDVVNQVADSRPPCPAETAWIKGFMPTPVPGATRIAYISGPMRGIPDYNFPAFFAAEEALLEAGWNTINPARIDSNCPGGTSLPLKDYARRDIAAIFALDPVVDAVIQLPGSEGEFAVPFCETCRKEGNYVRHLPSGTKEYTSCEAVVYPEATATGAQAEAWNARWLKIPLLSLQAALDARVEGPGLPLMSAQRAEEVLAERGVLIAEPPIGLGVRGTEEAINRDIAQGPRPMPEPGELPAIETAPLYKEELGIGMGEERNLLENDGFEVWAGPGVPEPWAGEARRGAALGLNPFADATQEIRTTDPVTGGQKGSKPVRYDLIPGDFASVVSMRPRQPGPFEVGNLLYQFWQGVRNQTALVDAAAQLVGFLGGDIAASLQIATVYGMGALKYDDNNWRKGYKWSLSYAAALRHLSAIERGEMMDPETKVPHYANVWWHCATLWTFATEGLGTDDRPSKGGK